MIFSQIGQVLIASFEGPSFSAETQALLELYTVGNILLDIDNLNGNDQAEHNYEV